MIRFNPVKTGCQPGLGLEGEIGVTIIRSVLVAALIKLPFFVRH
jgi:hypothetical protein